MIHKDIHRFKRGLSKERSQAFNAQSAKSHIRARVFKTRGLLSTKKDCTNPAFFIRQIVNETHSGFLGTAHPWKGTGHEQKRYVMRGGGGGGGVSAVDVGTPEADTYLWTHTQAHTHSHTSRQTETWNMFADRRNSQMMTARGSKMFKAEYSIVALHKTEGDVAMGMSKQQDFISLITVLSL